MQHQHPQVKNAKRFVQGIAVGHTYGGGIGATGGGGGDVNNRRGGAGGGIGTRFKTMLMRMTRPPARKKLLSIVGGVLLFALLLRRAQERVDVFMDGWGVTSGGAGGINDRGTIAYDL